LARRVAIGEGDDGITKLIKETYADKKGRTTCANLTESDSKESFLLCSCMKRVISKSLVRENRTQGSARGRLGNWPFYLDGRLYYTLRKNETTDYLKIASIYDKNWIRHYIPRDENIEKLYIANSSRLSVLDLACGTGNYLKKTN